MSKQKVQKSVNWSPSSRQKEPSLAPPVMVVQRTPISALNTDVSIPEYTPLKNNAVENHPLLRQFQTPQLQTSQPIQTKLTIGEVGDKYEQEADRVARDVVREINAPAIAQREETEEKIARKLIVQRDSIMAEETASQEVESSIHRAKGGGQSLDSSLQNSMGRAMGADFSGVRVHTDSSADHLNQSLQAKAFTTGQDVFFRQGAYQPGSREGQELIAHELTHVVQQNGGAVQRSPVAIPRNPVRLSKVIQRRFFGSSLTESQKKWNALLDHITQLDTDHTLPNMTAINQAITDGELEWYGDEDHSASVMQHNAFYRLTSLVKTGLEALALDINDSSTLGWNDIIPYLTNDIHSKGFITINSNYGNLSGGHGRGYSWTASDGTTGTVPDSTHGRSQGALGGARGSVRTVIVAHNAEINVAVLDPILK